MAADISHNQIGRNMLFLYFRMLLTMCIGLFTSRIILQTLGVTDYGIYNIVDGLVVIWGFINGSMDGGTRRFLTFALGKKDEGTATRVFCTSVLIHILTAVTIFALAETIGLYFLYEKLIIPQERLTAAFWAYQGTIISALISVISTPYKSLVIAEERMYVFAYISIIEVILRLLSAYILWIGITDKLILFSALNVCVQILIYVCYVLYCRRYFTVSRFRFLWDKVLLLSMVKFSSWTLNGTMALTGCIQGLNILLNTFFGPAVNAAYGIALIVQTKLTQFCNNTQMAFNPPITKCYASGEMESMRHLVIFNSKISYYLLLLITLPILICLSPLLNLWLDTVPEYTEQLTTVMIIISMIRALGNPLMASIYATGNIKRFQLWEGTVLLLVLPIAYILLKYAGVSPVWAILIYLFAESVALGIRIHIILPMINMKRQSYVRKVLHPIIATTILAVFIPFAIRRAFFSETSTSSIVLLVLLSLATVCTFSFVVGCEKEERKVIALYIFKFLQRKS